MKKIFSTLGVLILCAVLSVGTIAMMEGAAEGEGGPEGHVHSSDNHFMWQFGMFFVYLLVVGIVTGFMSKFSIKIGPILISRGTQIMRKKKK